MPTIRSRFLTLASKVFSMNSALALILFALFFLTAALD